jgi:frataxin-like iron-binding protein CyaY
VAEWPEEHEATCDQYEFCKLAVLQQQKINSTLASEIADARYEVEVVQEVMQEATEEMEKEVISAQE